MTRGCWNEGLDDYDLQISSGAGMTAALEREGFYQDNPEAALFLARMHLDLDEPQAAMFQAQETSYEEAVNQFIEGNPGLIDYWVTGKMD